MKGAAIPCLSALIALIWSTQFIVSVPFSVLPHGIRQSWPILDYPMYSMAHFEGDLIPQRAMVGTCDNGKEVAIQQEDLGGGYWHFQVLAKAVERADQKVIRDIVRIYESRHNLRLAALRVEDRPLMWRNDRLEPAPTKVLREFSVRSRPSAK